LIRESLADDTSHDFFAALLIVYFERDAVVVTEIEPVRVAMQVGAIAVVRTSLRTYSPALWLTA
jgi:hypothetical protein